MLISTAEETSGQFQLANGRGLQEHWKSFHALH